MSVIKRFGASGENPDDLFQIGCIGLIKAINNFNTELDVRFSTYAVPMIIGEIRRYLRDNNSIRVSRSLKDIAYKAMHVKERLISKNSKEPTISEIAKELDMSVERVREIMRIAQDPVSLETPIGEEEDSHLGDFIPDDDAPAPAEAASLVLLKEQINQVLSTLTEREEKVLRLRFGLEDGRSRTLEEVGQQFNVTRERIRQIEAKALRKLRHPNRSNKVRDYLD